MAVQFVIDGTTKDGKKVKVTVTLKKFCACKSSHPNCEEDAKKLAPEKVKPVLARWESNKILWLDNKVHPNFIIEVLEEITEVLEAVCVTARSEHLQGADVKVEIL
jgi:hypothetical protein